jgi:diguanylate cyclase (GGDEF)-like protein
MSNRRPVIPLVTLQAIAILGLAGATAAIYWTGQVTASDQVENIQQTARDLHAQLTDSTWQPFAYSVDRDRAHIDKAIRAIGAAEAHLNAIRTQIPESTNQIEIAAKELENVSEIVSIIGRASTDADLSSALEELSDSRETIDTVALELERLALLRAKTHYEDQLQRNLLLWAAGLVAVLVTAWLARRNVLLNQAGVDDDRRVVVRDLTDALKNSLDGKSDGETKVELKPVDDYRSLYDLTSQAISTLDELRKANQKIKRRSSFLQDLQEALSIADSEEQVFEKTAKAARIAYQGSDFSLLLIDPTSSRLRPQREDRRPVCEVATPEGCPALFKGKSVHSPPKSDTSINRCPRIKNDPDVASCAPLFVAGKGAAVAQLSRYSPEDASFDDLEALALATAARLGVVRSLAEQKAEAVTDPLTGLANKRAMDERLAALDAAKTPYAVIFGDLDHFKNINDTYGHETGDRCLQTFADVLRRASRDSDLPCRKGGEEFVLILPHAGMKAGLAVAMRIRAFLADASSKMGLPFTASLGVASRPDHGNTYDSVIRAADAAMYDAKEAGRDQVVPAFVRSNLEAAR